MLLQSPEAEAKSLEQTAHEAPPHKPYRDVLLTPYQPAERTYQPNDPLSMDLGLTYTDETLVWAVGVALGRAPKGTKTCGSGRWMHQDTMSMGQLWRCRFDGQVETATIFLVIHGGRLRRNLDEQRICHED